MIKVKEAPKQVGNVVFPSDLPRPGYESTPYMATNVTAKSGCHQCCRSEPSPEDGRKIRSANVPQVSKN